MNVTWQPPSLQAAVPWLLRACFWDLGEEWSLGSSVSTSPAVRSHQVLSHAVYTQKWLQGFAAEPQGFLFAERLNQLHYLVLTSLLVSSASDKEFATHTN